MNYTDLTELAKSYSDRSDADIDDVMSKFIIITEDKLNTRLRVKDMAVQATITTVADQEFYTLPSDFAGLRDAEIQKNSKFYTYEYLPPVQMNAVKTNQNSTEYFYTVIADQLQINPIEAADNTIQIAYYQKIPNLNATDTTNWLSDNYPSLYLAGIMIELQKFVMNLVGVQFWEAEFEKEVAALKMADMDDRWSGTPMRTRAS